MSTQPRHFHASLAAPAAAAAAAPVVTWQEAGQAAADALADNPAIDRFTWYGAFDDYLMQHHPLIGQYNDMMYLFKRILFTRRFGGAGSISHILIDTAIGYEGAAHLHRLDVVLRLLTDEELAAEHATIAEEPPIPLGETDNRNKSMAVRREMFRRAPTDAARAALREHAVIEQSNAPEVLYQMNRLPDERVLGTLEDFLSAHPIRHRPVHPLQTMYQAIDHLRATGTGPAYVAANIVATMRGHTPRAGLDPRTWNGTIAYLTMPELHAVYRVAAFNEDASIGYSQQRAWERYRIELGIAITEIRTQRANLAASLLIQRLALRDRDAARHLASVLTRTVLPHNARTHITTEPAAWAHGGPTQPAVLARRSKRKDAAAAGDDAAAAKSQKREEEEKKHGDDDD